MTPKAVLFDCDGVLVDSEPITNQILTEDLQSRGLDIALERVSALFTGGTMRSAGIEAAKLGADIPEDWLDHIYAKMFAGLAAGTPLIDGIEPLLDVLDGAGIRYGVGSNGPDRKMEITIGQHPKLWQRFKGRLYSAHTHAKPKPAPDLYLFVARELGVRPEDCIVVDDSPSGCRGAISANIKCFGLAEHDDGARLAAVGATVFHSLAKLPGLIGLGR